MLHLSPSGSLLNEYAVASNPDDAAVGPDGNIYISQVFSGQIDQFNPTTGVNSFFASSPFPLGLTWSVSGELWVGDIDAGVEAFNSSGVLVQSIFNPGDSAAEPALSGNIWDANISSDLVNQYTSSGSILTQTSFSPEQPGLAVLGDVPGEAPWYRPRPRIIPSSSGRARAPRSSSTASTARMCRSPSMMMRATCWA